MNFRPLLLLPLAACLSAEEATRLDTMGDEEFSLWAARTSARARELARAAVEEGVVTPDALRAVAGLLRGVAQQETGPSSLAPVLAVGRGWMRLGLLLFLQGLDDQLRTNGLFGPFWARGSVVLAGVADGLAEAAAR